MALSVAGVTLEVERGDITSVGVEAIVNAANNHFWMGGGVAGAIKRAGGQVVEDEAIAQGPSPVGGAVATGAGRLGVEHVIHAAVMGQDLATDAESIRNATISSLRLARDLNIRSIAFPAFGTGVGGFPGAESAEAMISGVIAFLRDEGAPELRKIKFVLFSEGLKKIFDEALERLARDS